MKHAIIHSLKNNVLKTIHEVLNSTNDLGLIIDDWADRRCRSYLGITCHFIDNRMMPQAYLIDFLCLKAPRNAESILRLTQDVLNRFNINCG